MNHFFRHIVVISILLLALNSAMSQTMISAPEGYLSVSEILPLPDFIPGAGALYIDPANAPVGPWLSYGKDGNLTEVVFMVPLSQMSEASEWANLATGTMTEFNLPAIDHVDLSFNGGHPGMAEQHYHIRLVLVSNEVQQAALTP